MRLERLRLVNFRQHADTELVLGAGLTGIVGPNGAGKTTLLEAIAWALYGAPGARGTRETIRRRGAGPRAPVRVELDFVLGPHRYRVSRTLGGAELFQDAEPAAIANSIGAVTEKITRLLGMTCDEFFNTYFTGQKQLAVMAAMGATDRAQFLSRVLGYDRLRTAQEHLRARRNLLRDRLQMLEASLPPLEELDRGEELARQRLAAAREAEVAAGEAFERAEQRLAEALPRWRGAQQARERMAALAADLRIADHRVTSARESFQGLDRQLVEANQARTRLDGLRQRLAPLEALRRERQLLDDLAEGFARRQAAEARLSEARARLESTRQRIARLPAADQLELAQAKVEELNRRVNALGERLADSQKSWARDQQEAETKRDSLRAQYQELKEQHERITLAGPDGVCPTCGRALGAEYERVHGLIERQLQDVLFNGNYYRQRIEQLKATPGELRELEQARDAADRERQEALRSYASLQAQVRDGPTLRAEEAALESRTGELEQQLQREPAGYDHRRHQEVRRALEEVEPVALQAERLRVAAERAGDLVAQAEAAERELSEHERQARALRDQLAGLGYSEEAFAAARQAHEEADRARREAELEGVRARAERRAAEEALCLVEQRRVERGTREEEARQAAREVALYNELDRAFIDLRTDLNLQLRPDLSELASGFVRDLTAGRYTELELDEDYQATLIQGSEARPVISGGEEDIANLALRLAISQMIADRAGQPLSLLVLDEIFGSLDEERRGAVLDLLRSLADRFPQVILITHIETVREGFDRVIRVEFDAEQGTARVRDEAPGAIDGMAA
jgi:exonuclease SbcC